MSPDPSRRPEPMTEQTSCPDCGDQAGEPEMHHADCPRVGTCGQIGPPWTQPPFHPWASPGAEPGPGEYPFEGEEQHRADMHPPSRRPDTDAVHPNSTEPPA